MVSLENGPHLLSMASTEGTGSSRLSVGGYSFLQAVHRDDPDVAAG